MPFIKGKLIPAHAAATLRDIMTAAGVDECSVTSVARTPADQARIMYANCVGTAKNQGVEKEHELYAAPGDLVINVFSANREKPREQIIALMLQKILELGPAKVSKHCADPSKLTVYDIDPESLKPAGRQVAFEGAIDAAVKDGRLSRFLSPHVGDPAYHIEQPVPAPTNETISG